MSSIRLASEWPLALAVILAGAGLALEHDITGAGRLVSLLAALVTFALIVSVSMRVAHHAETLAHRVGDPYGTMILTLSAVAVEVLILAILMRTVENPTLVRDTIYAAVMLDINGIIGLAALIGGLRHGEQPYNDDSGRTYSVMILTAMSISMIVPEFVPRNSWQAYSVFTIATMIVLYTLFLRLQTGSHSYFFSYTYPRREEAAERGEAEQPPSLALTIGLLVAGVAVIGVLAEVFAGVLDTGLEGTGAPMALLAVLVAAISAAPEILTAMRSALRNRMQAVINIALGASLSTVILTVPVMEAIALFTGQPFQMAMTPVQTVMVAVTLVVAAINLNDGKTNAIEGMTHFVLFMTFLMLTMIGL